MVYILMPMTMILSVLLLMPTPRFLDRIIFGLVELKINSVSEWKLGKIYCFLCFVLMMGNYYAFVMSQDMLEDDQITPDPIDPEPRSVGSLHIAVNKANGYFRNFLLYLLAFIVSVSNFAMTDKMRLIYGLQEDQAGKGKQKSS